MQALEMSGAAASVISVFETQLTIRTKLSYVSDQTCLFTLSIK